MIFDCNRSSDDEIRWYVKGQSIIYPRHLVPLAYQMREDDPDIAEVDTTVTGWPVRRFKKEHKP